MSTQPGAGTLNKPQQAVAVVLRSDLTGVLVIDGVEIPEDQLDRPTQSSMSSSPGAEQGDHPLRRGSPPRRDRLLAGDPHAATTPTTYTFAFRTTA